MYNAFCGLIHSVNSPAVVIFPKKSLTTKNVDHPHSSSYTIVSLPGVTTSPFDIYPASADAAGWTRLAMYADRHPGLLVKENGASAGNLDQPPMRFESEQTRSQDGLKDGLRRLDAQA